MVCAPAGEADYRKGFEAFSEKRFSDAAQYLQKSADVGHVLGMVTLAGRT